MNEQGVIYADELAPEEDKQRLARMREYDDSVDASLIALKKEQDEERFERQLAELNEQKAEAVNRFLELDREDHD